MALAEALEKMFAAFEAAWANDDFEALFSMLAALRPAVDELFDKVMVMCEDPDLRANRLSMLKGSTLAHGAACRFFGAATLAPHGSPAWSGREAIAITHSERFCAAARELVFLKRLD